MSYAEPDNPDVPETEPVGPDDLPGSEADEDGEEYVPLDEPNVERGTPQRPAERSPHAPPTPGAHAAPPGR